MEPSAHQTSAAELLADTRSRLADVEQAIRSHRFLDALAERRVPEEDLRALASEQWTIIASDRWAFAIRSGKLWVQENGEDAFDELNLVTPGQNSGWIQVAGPLDRIAQFKQIETTSLHHDDFPNLQQFRWGPENIANTPAEARSRMFVLPGSRYSDPEFSWRHVLAPSAIGFVEGNGLGREFSGDLFMGFSTLDTFGGPLFHFNLTGNRRKIAVDDPRLEDHVADNPTFHDITESESLLIGKEFGIVTDVETGPSGNLFVVSLSNGAIYEIGRRRMNR